MNATDKIIHNVSTGLGFLALVLSLAVGAGLGDWMGALAALPVGMIAMLLVSLTAHDALCEHFEGRDAYDMDEDVEVIDLDA